MKTVEVTYRYQADDKFVRAQPVDAEAARRRLDEGSQAFATLLDNFAEGSGVASRVIQVDPQDLGFLTAGESAPKHRPFAAVLGCSDARVPIELIFNEGPNDLFVVRVAGNGLGNDALGSLKYAVDHLDASLRLIVVLGHSGCGAVSAAVDVFLNPSGYLAIVSKHTLRGILDQLLLVVHASATRMIAFFGPDVTRHPRYREALIEVAVVTNAALSAHTVQQELGSGEGSGNGVRAVYGVYLIASREVWAPRSGSRDHAGLADAPRGHDDFVGFGESVMRTDRIAAMLR